MSVLNPVSFLHNRTDHTAQTDRLAVTGALAIDGAGNTWRQGVRGYNDLLVAAQAAPNMTVQVAAGAAYIKQTTALHGCYFLMNDVSFNVTITAAHATLPRNDLIIAKVEDAFFIGTNNIGSIVVVTGVAASTPVDPALPNNAIVLSRVVVTAAAPSITTGMIADLRIRTAALGAILPVRTTTERNAILSPYNGLHVSNEQTKNTERYNGTAWEILLTDINNPLPVSNKSGASTSTTGITFIPLTSGSGVTFTTTASGMVLVHIVIPSITVTAGIPCLCGFEIRLGAVIGSGTVFLAGHTVVSNGTTSYINLGGTELVPGLTVNTVYNARLMFASNTAGTSVTVNSGTIIVAPQ